MLSEKQIKIKADNKKIKGCIHQKSKDEKIMTAYLFLKLVLSFLHSVGLN